MDFDKSIISHIHHYSIIQDSFTTLKKIPVSQSFNSTSLPLSCRQPLNFLKLLWFYLFHMSYNQNYVCEFSRLACFNSNIHLNFKSFCSWMTFFFFLFKKLLNDIQLYECTTVFIYSPIGWFQFLVIMNTTAINIYVQVFMWV